MRRLVRAQLTRTTVDQISGGTVNASSTMVWVRHFTSFRNAVRRCTEIAVLECQPLDVIELSYVEGGFWLGTIKVHAGGRVEVNFSRTYKGL